MHVEWYDTDDGCSHPECVPNDDPVDTDDVFACGDQACANWHEVCEIMHPGVADAPVQSHCTPLPQECIGVDEPCECLTAALPIYGECSSEGGAVYVDVYAP